MTDIRILDAHADRVRATFNEPGIKANDVSSLLLLLAREVKKRRLGDPDAFRIQAWDGRRGWIEHRR